MIKVLPRAKWVPTITLTLDLRKTLSIRMAPTVEAHLLNLLYRPPVQITSLRGSPLMKVRLNLRLNRKSRKDHRSSEGKF